MDTNDTRSDPVPKINDLLWFDESISMEYLFCPAADKIFIAARKRGWVHIDDTPVHIGERNMPHWKYKNAIYFITFSTHRRMILSNPSKDYLLRTLLYYHENRINLYSAVIMPDHVHMLFQLLDGNPGDFLHSVKSYSANHINELMKRSGRLWQVESYDHIVRNSLEFTYIMNYIYRNPFRKQLADDGKEYPWLWVSPELSDVGWCPAPIE